MASMLPIGEAETSVGRRFVGSIRASDRLPQTHIPGELERTAQECNREIDAANFFAVSSFAAKTDE
jgi:hypothetical protein